MRALAGTFLGASTTISRIFKQIVSISRFGGSVVATFGLILQ
jgi:hypothetical protein